MKKLLGMLGLFALKDKLALWIRTDAYSDDIVIGDKAKNQMSRTNCGDIQLSFNQIGKAILTSGVNFDNAAIAYNKFISAIAYEANPMHKYCTEVLRTSENFSAYELDEEVPQSYSEFLFAYNIYWALIEGHTSEISAKRTAMDNALPRTPARWSTA